MKPESTFKVVIPNRGDITITGHSAFVQKVFTRLSVLVTEELEKSLQGFKGELKMIETKEEGRATIELVAEKEAA